MRIKLHRPSADWIKNVIIALLIISTLLLGRETGVFSDAISLGGESAQNPNSGQGEDSSGLDGIQQAGWPFSMSVNITDEASGLARYGVKYDSDNVSEVYERFSATLGEALGSSGEPEQVTRTQWEYALSLDGVFFDYLNPMPLSLIAQWLGTSISSGASEHSARRFCLALQGSNITLFYHCTLDGEYYRCDTALDGTSTPGRLMEFQPNGSAFAFEKGKNYSTLDPDVLFVGNIPLMYDLLVRNPVRVSMQTGDMLDIFGMSSHVAGQYTEADDTIVCVEGDLSLRISTGGQVSFKDSSGEGIKGISAGANPRQAEVVELARAFAQGSVGAFSGEARLCITGLDQSEDGGYTVRFGYAVHGLPVYLPGGASAAEITVNGGVITHAVLVFREYGFSEQVSKPLPEAQAAVAVQGGNGDEPLLVYVESGSEATPKWIKH